MRYTPVKAVAIVLVVLLVLGGAGLAISAFVGSSDDGSSQASNDATAARTTLAPTPTPQAGSSDAPDPALASFYGQEITWALCRKDAFECGTLTVPIDYDNPGDGSIKLALLKAPAQKPSQRIGSLVVNPGGPGEPGTDYAAGGSAVFGDPLLDDYDIVGFDPRGTGASDPVDCITDAQTDAFLAGDPDPETAAEGQAYEDGVEQLFAGCVKNSDALVGHISTVEAARDMDVLRSALGETKLAYLGASYGTKLGATYADLFPDKVGRFVLDGAIDISLDSRAQTLQQAGGFETAIRSYVQHCIDGGDCYLGDTLDAALAKIKTFLGDVEAKPLPTNDPDRPLRAGNAFSGVVGQLYDVRLWPTLDQTLKLALDGNGAGLLYVGDLLASRNDDGTYANNANEAIYAINCLDDPYAITPDQVAAQLPAFEKASPTFGDAFAWQLVNCNGIHVKATEPAPPIGAKGADPIVVVSTTRDPATPYAGGVALAKELDSGVLISRDGDGHTGYHQSNDCVDGAVEGYLVDGTVPQDGLMC